MKWVLAWIGVTLTTALLFGCGGNGGSSAATGGPRSETAPKGETDAAGSSSPPRSEPSAPTAYPQHAGFSASPVTPGQGSRLAQTGRIELPVRVAGAGTVSAFGQAEIGGGIVRTANAAPRAASGAGTVDLTLRLTSAAQKALADGGSFLMHVAVRYSGSRTAQQFTLPVGPRD